jgi:hypothetical protein
MESVTQRSRLSKMFAPGSRISYCILPFYESKYFDINVDVSPNLFKLLISMKPCFGRS